MPSVVTRASLDRCADAKLSALDVWDDTGLPWTKTSPNIPRSTSPFFYAATGVIGELPALSIGIGTPWQFEVAGAPGIDARRIRK